nr:MAG TPA: hypothetical protein [Caudoviricetes sp.]
MSYEELRELLRPTKRLRTTLLRRETRKIARATTIRCPIL